MIKFRFFLVVLIIIITGIVLQVFKVIDFTSLLGIKPTSAPQPADTEEIRSADEIPEIYKQYYIIFSGLHADEEQTANHLVQIFANTHNSYILADLDSPDFTDTILNSTEDDTLLIATEHQENIPETSLRHIERVVSNGAALSILIHSPRPMFQTLAGIDSISAIRQFTSTGIRFTEPFFPVMDEIMFDALDTPDSRLDLTISESSRIIAEHPDGMPLVWQTTYEKGTVLSVNSTLFTEKVHRGFLLQLILFNDDYGIAGIQADAVTLIRDFPSPLPQGMNTEIFANYQRDMGKFLREIWWPDINTIQQRHNLRFTGLIRGSGSSASSTASTSPTASIPEKDRLLIGQYSILLGSTGAELGIQGYGDADSLWNLSASDRQDISGHTEELTVLKEALDNTLGEIPYRTYAPPVDLAYAAVLEEVRKVFPDLQVLTGLYTDYALLQDGPELPILEFGMDSDFADWFSIPVFSSGYTFDPAAAWASVNGVAQLGLFSHMITPTFLLNSLGPGERRWSKLQIDFDEEIRKIFNAFSFLEPKYAYEIAEEYQKDANYRIYSTHKGQTITITLDQVLLPKKFYFRSSSTIESLRGGIVRPLGRDNLYLLEAREPVITLQVSQ